MSRVAVPFAVLGVCLLAGCASGARDVVFITKTSFAVDVSAQPAGASIGYDRVEGYLGPRFDNGHVPPVAASFVTNGKLFDRQIRQVYATGAAAQAVTMPDDTPLPISPRLATRDGKSETMFFNTGTTVGLKIGFGTSGVTDWLTLGYKRREISVIPVAEMEFPSVLATLESEQDTSTADKTSFGVGQYFATGVAAQAVANDPAVRKLFRHRARAALGAAEQEEKAQAENALSALVCLAQVPVEQLPMVFRNAEKAQLLEGVTAAQLSALPGDRARVIYTRHLAASDGASLLRSKAMVDHRAVVCAFAGH